MRDVLNTSTRHADVQPASQWFVALAVCAAFLAAPVSISSAHAQSPTTQPAVQPSPAPQTAPAAPTASAAAPSAPDAAPAQPATTNVAAPTLTSPPVAIVPLDKSIPGAALSVAGPMQAFNGR